MTPTPTFNPPGFRLGPPKAKIGCLLIHGFSGGPGDLRYLGDRLAQRGWTIAVPALAGHRPTPPEKRSPSEWVAGWEREVTEALVEMVRGCDHVHVAGLSMGALLTIRLARRETAKIRSITLLSTPLEVASQSKRWPVSIAGALLPGRRVKFKDAPDIRQPSNTTAETRTHMPLGALAGFFLLQSEAEKALGEIRQPALAIHSQQDHTAPFSNLDHLIAFMTQSDLQTSILTESYHVISNDVERDRVATTMIEFIEKRESDS